MLKELKGDLLSKTYRGRKVVNDVSICITQGEVVGLLGPNGAGKTTTFYMMVGLVPPDQGSITYAHEIVTDLSLDQRAILGIAYLPQEASIFRDLTVEENILVVLEQKKLSKNERYHSLDQIIHDFSLKHVRRSKGRELSGGERRRVEIARTMALVPSFILLDEPFAGVDPLAVSDLKEIIRTLKEKGIGVLITDHNVRETLDIVDRGYIMNLGSILAQGTPQELVENEVAKKFYLGEEFRI